jgi:hypothetical protein
LPVCLSRFEGAVLQWSEKTLCPMTLLARGTCWLVARIYFDTFLLLLCVFPRLPTLSLSMPDLRSPSCLPCQRTSTLLSIRVPPMTLPPWPARFVSSHRHSSPLPRKHASLRHRMPPRVLVLSPLYRHPFSPPQALAPTISSPQSLQSLWRMLNSFTAFEKKECLIQTSSWRFSDLYVRGEKLRVGSQQNVGTLSSIIS